MTSFLYDNTALPSGKADVAPLTGNAANAITAAEWNSVVLGITQLRDSLIFVMTALGYPSGDFSTFGTPAFKVAAHTASTSGDLVDSGRTIPPGSLVVSELFLKTGDGRFVRLTGFPSLGGDITPATTDTSGKQWEVGDRAFALGGSDGLGGYDYICNSAGTAGTYGEGRTCSVAGTAVTLSGTSTVLKVGQYISLQASGYSHSSKITAINGTAVTIADSLPSHGAGVTISWVPPTFKTMAVTDLQVL